MTYDLKPPASDSRLDYARAMAARVGRDVRIGALIDACRIPVGAIALGNHGPWRIAWSNRLAERAVVWFAGYRAVDDRLRYIGPYDSMTMLFRMDARAPSPAGFDDPECVMEDSDRELRRHLPILLCARGRVLVSGLGLGCVVRGLLSKRSGPLSEPDVTHIDVVEVDPHIIEACGAQFANEPRVTIHLGDVRWMKWPSWKRWDYAWHDIWVPDGSALHVEHARLITIYNGRVTQRQGAWQMPREGKRAFTTPLLGMRRRQLATLTR